MDDYFKLLKLDPSPETYEKAGAAGELCLTLASSWAALLLTLRYYWETLQGTHFKGVFDEAIDSITPHAGHLHSARKIVQAGVDARNEVIYPRVHANKPGM